MTVKGGFFYMALNLKLPGKLITNLKLNKMTLLKVYSKNGHCRHNDTANYGFNNLLNDFPFNTFFPSETSHATPRVNITEDKESYRILIEVPGIEKDKIKMSISKDMLTISGNDNYNEDAEKYTYQEFNYRNFERSFRIPESVDTEKITASFNNGILTVSLPKRDEAIDKGPRNIEIS
jgi:HSP20 family protein